MRASLVKRKRMKTSPEKKSRMKMVRDDKDSKAHTRSTDQIA